MYLKYGTQEFKIRLTYLMYSIEMFQSWLIGMKFVRMEKSGLNYSSKDYLMNKVSDSKHMGDSHLL